MEAEKEDPNVGRGPDGEQDEVPAQSGAGAALDLEESNRHHPGGTVRPTPARRTLGPEGLPPPAPAFRSWRGADPTHRLDGLLKRLPEDDREVAG